MLYSPLCTRSFLPFTRPYSTIVQTTFASITSKYSQPGCRHQNPNKLPLKKLVVEAFLPQNYPNSVHDKYTPFIKWLFLQNIMGAAICGILYGIQLLVLSTQSMLLAVGVGSSPSLAIAATFQWVIKDALGQVGGILAAGALGKRFDLYTRQLRFLSVLGLSAASLVEISTLCWAILFLPLAGFANLVKNVCWVTSSATRASLLRSFSKEENLGDLTAKYASQATAANLIGTGIGLACSHFFSLATFSQFSLMYIPFNIGLMIGLYKTTKFIRNTNLNFKKLITIFENFTDNALAADITTLNPENLRTFLLAFPIATPDSIDELSIKKSACPLKINPPFDKLNPSIVVLETANFILYDSPSREIFLWIRDNSSDVEIIEAILFALFHSHWKLEYTELFSLARKFIKKIVSEARWNIDSFMAISPEIPTEMHLRLSG